MNDSRSKTIAFLFPAFPVLHQTFVLWEVLALRKRGISIALYSIKRPSTSTQQPEGEELAREVHYLPSLFRAPVLAANLRALSNAPARYLALFSRLVRAWWEDRETGSEWRQKRGSRDAPDCQLTLREHLKGRFDRSPLLYLLKSLWLVPRAVHLGEQLRAGGIEHVHAHWASYSATMALIIHWFFDMRFSFSAHAYDIYLVPRLLTAKVRESAFAVTCGRVNAAFLNRLAAGSGKEVIVNYHGVDLARFRPRDAHRTSDAPSIVTCGRLEPYKGHHILLRAFARLDTRARLIIVGEGPQRRSLADLAGQLGVAERVEFTGPMPQSRLREIYAPADLFVLASVVLERSGKRDVIPNVLAEAMAMRVPVVATDVSGIGELITDGESGRLVRANDADALAAVLGELLAAPEERDRLARGGVEKVAAEFDREVNIEALASLFRQVGSGQESVNATAEPHAAERRSAS